MSGFGFEQRPEYDRPLEYDHIPWSDQPSDEEPEIPTGRRVTRVLMVAGGIVALLLVGMVAFAGTVLLGGGPTKPRVASGQGGGQQAADPVTSNTTGVPTDAPTTEAPSPAATTPSPAKTTPGRAIPVKPGGGVENLNAETAVLVIVNAERSKSGCKQALTVDSRLAAAARKHSADMAARNYFSHTTPDGVDFSTRIDNEGYLWSLVGENIAAGQEGPAEVMKAWMKSPGHRANILNCKFRQIGIGIAVDGRRPIWTQDFGTPR